MFTVDIAALMCCPDGKYHYYMPMYWRASVADSS
jgi:hypothetical protein